MEVFVYKHSERAGTGKDNLGEHGAALLVSIFPLEYSDDESIEWIAKGIKDFLTTKCMACGSDMEDVKPVADATECQECLAVRWNKTGKWDMSQCKAKLD